MTTPDLQRAHVRFCRIEFARRHCFLFQARDEYAHAHLPHDGRVLRLCPQAEMSFHAFLRETSSQHLEMCALDFQNDIQRHELVSLFPIRGEVYHFFSPQSVVNGCARTAPSFREVGNAVERLNRDALRNIIDRAPNPRELCRARHFRNSTPGSSLKLPSARFLPNHSREARPTLGVRISQEKVFWLGAFPTSSAARSSSGVGSGGSPSVMRYSLIARACRSLRERDSNSPTSFFGGGAVTQSRVCRTCARPGLSVVLWFAGGSGRVAGVSGPALRFERICFASPSLSRHST